MKNHTTILVLALVAALATTLVATGIVAIASSAAAFGSGQGADTDSGISIHNNFVQKQKCQTAGGTSPITGSCTATGTNTVTNSGGVIGAP
jgi:hypothetical protein